MLLSARIAIGLILSVFLVSGFADRRQAIRVPQDEPTLAAAVAAAHPGDTIVVDSGVYAGGVTIPKAKSNLTIRGVDRNAVVLDGGDRQHNGIVVHADGVSIVNVTAHDFLDNAFYWDDVTGFRAAYLTAWNIQGYGIYSEGSTGGVIDHDYVSGAADAAYYIGECRPCRSTISHVVARLSAVGYSGTNASGSLVIRDSAWEGNGVGILPNTYANEKNPPQAGILIVRNDVSGSGRGRVPIHTPLAGFIGIGIAIAGGNDNVVRGNDVSGSERYGIAVFPTAHHVSFLPAGRRLGPYWRPRGNRVVGNRVLSSGRADLALAAGVGRGNCFAGNLVGTTLPAPLQSPRCPSPVARRGDPGVAAALTAPLADLLDQTVARRQPPDYTAGPQPPPQPNAP